MHDRLHLKEMCSGWCDLKVSGNT